MSCAASSVYNTTPSSSADCLTRSHPGLKSILPNGRTDSESSKQALEYYKSQLVFRGIPHTAPAPTMAAAINLLKTRLGTNEDLPIHPIIFDWMKEFKKDGGTGKRKRAESSTLRRSTGWKRMKL
ncbi:hypothetical protein ACEPPN_014437 [Leptodophora sp. 'Broadleaf-Isolate-01']